MSLRIRAVLVLLTSAAVALVVFLQVAERVVGDGFSDLEAADARERVERSLAALSSAVDKQAIATREIALAPNTTEVLRGDRDRLHSVHEDLTALGDRSYDAVLIVGPLGQVVHTVGADEALPPGIRSLAESAVLRLPAADRSDVRGIATADGAIATVVAYRVPGNRVGLGTVLSLDVLTPREIEELGERSFLDLSVTPYADRSGFALSPFTIRDLDISETDGDLTAETTLVDPVGLFVLTVGSDVPQAIADAGRLAYERLVWLIVLAAVAVMSIGVLWFERAVVSRIGRLSGLVDRSRETDRPTIEMTGDDEVARLADHIETTLRRLEDAQEDLRDANHELALASELKDDFVSMVSHEFRTPLTSIRGYAETMLTHVDRLTPEQQAVFIDKVLTQSLNLTRMVDDLLTLSSARKGTMHRDPDDHRVIELARSVLDALPDTSGITLEIPEDLVVHADADHVCRILTNYLENALKYGAAPIRVSGRTTHDGRVELRVADRGPGVPESFQEQLFERFTQASVGTQRTAKGVGLGLSIVQTLAAENGGVVWFEPNDPGSVFGVRLPAGHGADPVPTPDATALPEAPRESTPEPAEQTTPAGTSNAAAARI